MAQRVLLTSAGNAPSNNLMRSLRAGSRAIRIVGCHDDRFVLKNSAADRNYLVAPPGHDRWLESLRRVIEDESIQLVIPSTDDDVTLLSQARRKLQEHLFLPSASLLETCRDKYRLIRHLGDRGVAVPATYQVTRANEVGGIFRKLGRARPLWCRVRTGAGALGALPVNTPEQASAWIGYWGSMRGVPADSFILSEYLPGRDFGCQSLWKDGRMVLAKTYERISYLGTGSRPAEVSSVAALAKTVDAPAVVEASAKAIRSLDSRASGVFGVDLKENAEGVPCLTEINAGRFSSATNIIDLAGRHNMASLFVRLALGKQVALGEPYEVVNDWYMVRDIDAPPHIFHASTFFDNIGDASQPVDRRSTAKRGTTRGRRGSRALHHQAEASQR